MDVQINIWDFPRTEEQAIIFFHNKWLLPKTKQCINGHIVTLYSYENKHFWKFNTVFWSIFPSCSFHNFANKYSIFIIFFFSLALAKLLI